jgi:ketosteroid isomerase-like protein
LRRALAAAALLVLFAPAAGPAAPHTETPAAEAEKQVREAQARRFEVMVQGDMAALAPLLAEDLVYVHGDGKVETKAQLLESLASGRLRYRAIAAPDAAVRVYGEAAVVTGRADVQATAGGRDVAFAARYLAVYVREGGAWRLAAWQTTRLPE